MPNITNQMSKNSSFNIGTSKIVKIGELPCELRYPNVGQILEIENKKMLLSNGQYTDYVTAPIKTRSLVWAIDLIDAMAHFSVLVPGLAKKLDAGTFMEIDLVTAKEIVKVYKTEFMPWYQGLMKMIHEETLVEIEAGDDSPDKD